MDAIILAGGKGTRLRNAVQGVPKPLAPICGVPFLDLALQRIEDSREVQRVVLAVGYMGDMIVERYSAVRRFSFEIRFSIETHLLGTGGALRNALSLAESQDVLVQNGDTFIEVDYRALISQHRERNAEMTMVLTRVAEPERYGTVNVGPDLRIHSFAEKSAHATSNLINAGVYLIRRDLLTRIPEGRVVSLERDLLPSLVQGRSFGFESAGRFIDIGTPESYQEAQHLLKEATEWHKKRSS